METTTCEKCGVIITPGMWPFCPHPVAESAMIIGDEIPGGMVVENYGPHPIRFDSYSAMARYREAHGLQLLEKFCPAPGTDKDPQGIPNPMGYKDPYTLAQGAALIARNGGPAKEWDGVEAGVLRDIQVGTITQRDAEALASGDKGRQSRFARRTENHGG